MSTTAAATGVHRSWRDLLAAFVPVPAALELPVPPGQHPPAHAQCRRGQHVWLEPEQSLRSARTGFTIGFCRYCTAQQRLVPPRVAQPSRAIPLLLPR